MKVFHGIYSPKQERVNIIDSKREFPLSELENRGVLAKLVYDPSAKDKFRERTQEEAEKIAYERGANIIASATTGSTRLKNNYILFFYSNR